MSGQPSFSTTTIIFLIIGIIIGAGLGNYFTTNSLRILLNDNKSQVSELNEQVSNFSQEIMELKTQQATFENQISNLETQISELDGEKTSLTTEISDQEHSISELEDTIDGLNNRLGDRRHWKIYSDHGIYFEYLPIHNLTMNIETDEKGLIYSYEPNEEGELNYFHVNWSPADTGTSYDEALDSLLALLEPLIPTMSSSVRINSTVNSHDMIYQYFTTPGGEELPINGINAFWHCENSNRDFTVEYYSNQQDTLADFYQNIESFECHSQENGE
jgi:polyhydroxyalkanoate synthesis regulator phasin